MRAVCVAQIFNNLCQIFIELLHCLVGHLTMALYHAAITTRKIHKLLSALLVKSMDLHLHEAWGVKWFFLRSCSSHYE